MAEPAPADGPRLLLGAPIAANIRDCLGCGYCNIGCAYGRKLSMLDTLLPQAQEMDGPGSLRIVSECEAEGLEAGAGRVDGISCRANGPLYGSW